MLRPLPTQLLKAAALVIISGFLLTVLITTMFPAPQPYFATMAQQRAANAIKVPNPYKEQDNGTNSGTVPK
jgi:hypothetical protein